MKLKQASIHPRGEYLRVVFEHESGDVRKQCRLLHACVGDFEARVPYMIEKMTVEAERDIASRMFGGDWMERVTRAGTPQRESLVRGVAEQLFSMLPLGVKAE